MVWLPKIGGKYYIVDHFYGLFFYAIPVTLVERANHGRYTVLFDLGARKGWATEEYKATRSELYCKLDDALKAAGKHYSLNANSFLMVAAKESRGFRCQECNKISVLPKTSTEERVCAHCGEQVRPMLKQHS